MTTKELSANELAFYLQNLAMNLYKKDSKLISEASSRLGTIPLLEGQIESLQNDIVKQQEFVCRQDAEIELLRFGFNLNTVKDKSEVLVSKSPAKGRLSLKSVVKEHINDLRNCITPLRDNGLNATAGQVEIAIKELSDALGDQIEVLKEKLNPVEAQSNLVNAVKDHIEDLKKTAAVLKEYPAFKGTAIEVEIAIKELSDALEVEL